MTASIIGFNQAVADNAQELKKKTQRATSARQAGKRIKSIPNYTLPNPVLGHPALTREV